MSKHTPGPWRFSSHPHDGNYMRIHCGSDPREGDNLRGYCGEANARLIAAAPELLEALQAFANEIVPINPHDPLWVNARAAIAKATGEQP